jgi:hypothetical protein
MKFVEQPIFKLIIDLLNVATYPHEYTLIAQLLMTIIQKKVQTKKVFSIVVSFVRIHLIWILDLDKLLRDTYFSHNQAVYKPENTTPKAHQ